MLRAGWGNTKGGGVTSASGLAQLRFPRAKSQIVTQTCKQLGGAARLAGSPSQWGGAQVKTVTSRPTSSLLAPAPTPVIFFPLAPVSSFPASGRGLEEVSEWLDCTDGTEGGV